jgi:hypothetical protein
MESFKELTEVAKMQRQHYQLVADVIASLEVTTAIKKAIALKFADAFEPTNKLFKRDRFIKATKAKGDE